MSWIQHKEQAKHHFRDNQYDQALKSYRASLNASCPESEKQVILSNIVACRLKIGGPAMAAAAVEDAKKCVALNERWAKGHVRLASAYIALGDHSNDACNSLQRSLSLDPSNQTARQMLMRELRRDRIVDPLSPSPSAPYEDMDESRDERRSAGVEPTFATESIDESTSIRDRISFFWVRTVSWYNDQPNDVKSLLKVILAILVLYFCFGGTFGLGGSGRSQRGNYERGNAYDRFRNEDTSYGTYSANRQRSNGYESYQRRATSYDDDYNRAQSNSYHFPNLFDGSVPSLLCLGGILYLCHRNGVNPFQALWMIQMFGGGRHGRRPGMRYGMGHGMRRPGYGGGFRRRGAWY
eukprot:CAMPEP_0178907250 /NCGR_PEP_ID=MMETSP0786-20121207/7265_1 /TAXON_ID=186022 /ORGANISM="Thalassionema frauenfeldii, Strain CCMP 1798" /LENGTH=351 /DNA_ID=CAMNT_0020579025 /DNA_START=173 /DNA_END=1228 /DNA_ORIENTATION=-